MAVFEPKIVDRKIYALNYGHLSYNKWMAMRGTAGEKDPRGSRGRGREISEDLPVWELDQKKYLLNTEKMIMEKG